MAYQSLKISEAIQKIENYEYLIPDIQREFVWSAEQIELLFDSLMSGYPIGTMLFWEVTGETKFDYRFYRFLKSYRDFFSTSGESHIFKKPEDQKNSITAILDGQQRLTALYIGIKGSYSIKKPRKANKNIDDNFHTKKLYIQIDGNINFNKDDGREYNFKFWTDDEIKHNYMTWFPVSEIFGIPKYEDINDNQYLENNKVGRGIVSKLYNMLHNIPLMNYYVEKSQEIDKALNIFIRVNSQGEPLSYPDLIMSIVISNWKYKDARKEFRTMLSTILDLGFHIKKDFVLKLFLILYSPNIKFQVKNFTSNMARVMEEEWDRIKDVLEFGFAKLNDLGFSDSLLTSKNAILPILFIFYNVEDKVIYFNQNKVSIKNWLSLVLYMQVFSGSSDDTLKTIRDLLSKDSNKYKKQFPNEDLNTGLKNILALSSPDEGFIEGTLMGGKNSNYLYISNLLFPDRIFHLNSYRKAYSELTTKQLKSLDLDSKSETLVSEYLYSYLNVIPLENEISFLDADDPLFPVMNTSPQHITRNTYNEFIQIMKDRKAFLIRKIKEMVNI